MSGIFYPRLLAFIREEPKSDAGGELFFTLEMYPLTVRSIPQIFVSIFQKLSKLRQELEDEQQEALNLGQVADMWIHFTDPIYVQ